MTFLMFLLFINVFKIYAEYNAEIISDYKRREPGYFFIHAKTFLAGKNETVCLILNDAHIPTKALIDLKIKERHHVITKIMHSDHSCFDIPIPHHNSTEVLQASLQLQIQLNGSVYSAHNQDAILIYPNTDVTFIETDRNIYSHGDNVKIRVLVLGQDLMAPPTKKFISYLKLINPQGFTVATWNNIPTNLGLAQIEHQLAEETTLGKWKIESNGINKYFYVKRYVLPRFKIEIFSPKVLYVKAPSTVYTICAKYSFEKHVQGMCLMKISYNYLNINSTTKFERLKGGCATFSLSNSELNLDELVFSGDQNHATMSVVATITEEGSNHIETEATTVTIKPTPFEIRFSEENVYFQPGLPYRGKVRLVENNVEAVNQMVRICYQIAIKKAWNIKLEECSNFEVDTDGTIVFTIYPFKDSVVEVRLTAKSLNYSEVENSLTLKKWYSLSNSYIYIERNSKSLSKCKSTQQYTVYYTTNKFKTNENVTFFYMVKTRNEILQMRRIQHSPRRHNINFKNELINIIGKEHKFLKVENLVDRFILKFRLHNKIMSKSQLMVFYFAREETIAGSIDIYVEKCLMNTVNTSWINNNLYPGEGAILRIETSPSSLCAVSATDKASSFLSAIKPLNVQSVLQPYLQSREIKPNNKPNCLLSHKRKLESFYLENYEDLLRKRRRRASTNFIFSKDYDTYEMLNNFGTSVISNMRVISKPCLSDENTYLAPKLFSMTSTMYEVLNEERGVSVRSYFPETWLFELVPVGKSGNLEMLRYLPHTISTWVTNVFCVSPTEGVSIALKQDLTVFQPFFVEILAPYSIKRYEILHLQVAIFNYMNFSLPIRLKLANFSGLELVDSKDGRHISVCVKSDNKLVHNFRVKGMTLGKVKISVIAEVESSYPSECGPETIINKRDVVHKMILVEPEGHLSQLTKSILLCGTGEATNITINADIPDDVIEDSIYAKLVFNSDLLGPNIQHLDKFLEIPAGCGEQVMAMMAPNIYILRYLKATNKLTPQIRQRAIKNIKIGYQRILDYSHKDGSYSAFGYHDKAGSMFLTAFVVRTLQQSKEYVYIDETVINKATQWIIQNQLENGCFAAVSHVFQDMGGTSSENSTAALTAYVIISLMESHINLAKSVKNNAMYCIRGQLNPDKYTLAISTYALYLLEWEAEGNRYLDRLLEIATKENNLMWWSNQSVSASINVEMTGYALMSLIHKISNENLIHAGAVVRWLTTQRTSQGGFYTTQDTVVALDSISRYSSLVKNRDPELFIKIKTGKKEYEISIQKQDNMKSNEIILSTLSSKIDVVSTGKGCLLAQLLVKYNVNNMLNNEAFNLVVAVSPVSTVDKCSVAIISPCISYKGNGHLNMAVLEITMPSGYEPDRASLFRLVEEDNNKIKRFEEFMNKVVLYFTELSNEPICVPFNINENVIIDNQTDAIVKIYDYYNPELLATTSYKVNKCQPNSVALVPELPGLNNILNNNLNNNKYSDEKYTKENSKIIKRDLERKPKFGLNEDFINMDVEMATPSGMEGNLPVYVDPISGKSIKN